MSQTASCSAPVESCNGSPVILQHPVVARRLASFELEECACDRQTPLARARLEHQNRCCPNCRRVTVHPVELDDGLLNRWGMTIPASATVVGFWCRSCGHEWTPQRLAVVSTAE